VDEVMECSDGERSRHQPLQATLGQRAIEAKGRRVGGVAATGEQEADSWRQSPRRKRERFGRRGIEPLHVVDRDENDRILRHPKKACAEPAGVMEQEAAYLAALPMAVAYHVDGTVLELLSADGTRLVTYTRAKGQ
jgi:hypothetical protein